MTMESAKIANANLARFSMLSFIAAPNAGAGLNKARRAFLNVLIQI
jgi:hypothetical protein